MRFLSGREHSVVFTEHNTSVCLVNETSVELRELCDSQRADSFPVTAGEILSAYFESRQALVYDTP